MRAFFNARHVFASVMF